MSDSEPALYVSSEAGNQHDCWLAIARQEKIAILMKIYGYNPYWKNLPLMLAPLAGVFHGSGIELENYIYSFYQTEGENYVNF